jgi:hypothetical protein
MCRDGKFPHISTLICGNDACSTQNWWLDTICLTCTMKSRKGLYTHNRSNGHKAAVIRSQTPATDNNELRLRESNLLIEPVVPDPDSNDEMVVENDLDMELEMDFLGDATDATLEHNDDAIMPPVEDLGFCEDQRSIA